MLSTEFRAEEAPHKLYSCFGFCRHPQTLFGVAGQQDQTSHWRVRLTRPHRPRRRTQVKGPPRHPQDSRPQKWPRFKLYPRTSPSLVRTSSSSASGTPRSACISILGYSLRNCILRLCSYEQRRCARHLPRRLHPDPSRRLPPPHRWPLCQEAVQEGADAHR